MSIYDTSKPWGQQPPTVRSIPTMGFLNGPEEQDNLIRIDLYSHGFSVKPGNNHYRILTYDFTRRYVKWIWLWNWRSRRKEKKEQCCYCLMTRSGRLTYFHRGQYEEFLRYLKQARVPEDKIVITKHDPQTLTWPTLPIEMLPKWELREVQQQVKDFTLENEHKPARTTLIGLAPGQGKTVTMLAVGAEVKSRFLIFVRPQYIERWIDAFLDTYPMDKKELIVVQGSAQLKKLFHMAQMGTLDHVKAIVISNKTYQSYLKAFEQFDEGLTSVEGGWPVLPKDVAHLLGAKYVYIDEGHQDFHLNFKIISTTHTCALVTATGTLIPDDPFIKKVTEVVYPMTCRFVRSIPEAYVKAHSVFYRFEAPQAITYMTNQGYSHVEFEKSVMRHKPTLNNYCAMIKRIVDRGYFVEAKQKHHKCIIFVSTVELATYLTKHLQEAYPESDCRRYTQEDPFDNILEADIIVSTVISAGTALDIPGLSCNILTQSLSSSQSNMQVIGRLRKLKDIQPQFYWLVCEDFEKHIEYHESKKELFKGQLASYVHLNTNLKL